MWTVERRAAVASGQEDNNNHFFQLISCGSLMRAMFRVSRSKTDVIHVHGYRTIASILFGLYAKIIVNKPVVLTLHGIFPRRGLGDSAVKWIYDRTIGKFALMVFDVVIALNEESGRTVLRISRRCNLRIIPNSIDLERFENSTSPELFFSKFGVPRQLPLLLYVGRLAWHKNISRLLAAIEIVTTRYGPVSLVLIGKDYGASGVPNSYTQIGASHIYKLGEVSERELLSAYRAASIFLLSSSYEGQPTVVLEAFANHVPVIASSEAGSSLIVNGRSGTLVNAEQPYALADGIIKLLSDVSFAKRITENAWSLLESRYTWQENAKRILTLYHTIANRPGHAHLLQQVDRAELEDS